MRFGLLDRYLFKTMTVAALAGLIGLTCVIWISSALRELSLVTGKGQTFLVFLHFTALSLPALVIVIAPVAVFAATLYTLNKLNSDSELIVMSASGISPRMLFKPFALMAVIAAALVAFMTLHVMPASFRELRDMITRIRGDFIANVVKEGQFITLDQGITFHYRERSGQALLGIFFQDSRDEAKSMVYIAERGQTLEIEGKPFLVLEQGSIQQQSGKSQESSIVTFERYGVDLSSFGQDGANVILKPRERTTHALLFPDRNEPYYRQVRGRFRAELHDRFLAPIYVVAFILIGFAALGEPRTTRQGRGTAMVAASLAVIGLRIAGFALSSMMVRSNGAVYLSYALPLLSIAACVLIIVAGPRLRPLFARLNGLGDGLIAAARLRFARPA
ncbi:MAG: LPS export ABC transporter permease LptF [Beijerinckiaceae bacterium]|jgi:lipopolysaccharide export system permease protein|nr:LPS export ABC transporter permease LptF [Beijerinckiaceae bacterium]